MSYRFRDKRRFQSKIANFSSRYIFCAPTERFLLELGTGPWVKNLEWWGYWADKEVLRYLQPSGYNTPTWQTDGRTPRLRIPSCGKNHVSRSCLPQGDLPTVHCRYTYREAMHRQGGGGLLGVFHPYLWLLKAAGYTFGRGSPLSLLWCPLETSWHRVTSRRTVRAPHWHHAVQLQQPSTRAKSNSSRVSRLHAYCLLSPSQLHSAPSDDQSRIKSRQIVMWTRSQTVICLLLSKVKCVYK